MDFELYVKKKNDKKNKKSYKNTVRYDCKSATYTHITKKQTIKRRSQCDIRYVAETLGT